MSTQPASDTPLTDVAIVTNGPFMGFVSADFARDLERQLAAITAARNQREPRLFEAEQTIADLRVQLAQACESDKESVAMYRRARDRVDAAETRVRELEYDKAFTDLQCKRLEDERETAVQQLAAARADAKRLHGLLAWFVRQMQGDSGTGESYWEEFAEYREACALLASNKAKP